MGGRLKANPWEDHYARRARREKYAARSVYKLQQIQKKFRLLRKGDRVLDLGCAPGSWLQFAAEVVGPSGRVVGVDLKAVSVKLPAHVRTFTADILWPDAPQWEAVGAGFRAVLSDMAPATSGNKTVDHHRSMALARAALEMARRRLRTGGAFVCKVFQGEDLEAFLAACDAAFTSRRIFKPEASRSASREVYIIGTGKKQEEHICPDTANGPP